MADTPLAQHDFYNPFMAAAILDSKGNKIPLWTNIKDGGSSAVFEGHDLEQEFGIQSLPFLSEIVVSFNLGEYPVIKAVLTPPYREGIALLDSPLMEWGRSILEVQFGYIFGPSGLAVQSPVFQGVILKPDIQIGPEIHITLNAQGVGAFSMARQESGRQLSNVSRETIIRTLIDANQIGDVKFSLDDQSMSDGNNDTVSGPLLAENIKFSQGFKTDLQALWDVVKEAQCWMTFVGNKLFIVPRGNLDSDPKLTLTLFNFNGGQLGPQLRTFPILNASSPTMAVYLPASTFGLKLTGISSTKAIIEQSIIQDKGQPALGGGASTSTSLSKEGTPAYLADINNDRAKAQAQQEYEKSRTGMGINLEIDTLGIPDLLPGDVVNVQGLGKRISGPKIGNYGVFTVTHTYNANGYVTSATLVSNTSPLARSKFQDALKLNDKVGPQSSPNQSGTVNVKAKTSSL